MDQNSNICSSTYTMRGRGSCPNCKETYLCRYKPESCQKCGFNLGGSYEPKMKRVKKSCPDVVKVSEETYSVKTSSKDDRCFVVKEGKKIMCLNSSCKPLRATFSASGKLQDFRCKHVDAVTNSTSNSPTETYVLSQDMIASYSGDKSTKEALTHLLSHIPEGHPSVVRATDLKFVVFGQPTATNTIGYCHVHIESEENRVYRCTSKSCRQFVSKSKQAKVRATCLHLHVLYCLLHQEPPAPAPAPAPATTTSAASTENETPLSRETTLDIAMTRSLPYKIPESVIQTILKMDASSLLGTESGWPDTIEPTSTVCFLCQSPLSKPRVHPGQSASSGAYLITELNPFKKVQLLVKMCSNTLCKAMHPPNPVEIGLFNISDKVIVSLDIMLEIREFFKHGHPLTNVIEAKLEALKIKSIKENCPTENQLVYIARLLYNGFYCFEAITERDMNTAICGICGICPEVLLGDGNEKNCCENSQILYQEENNKGHDPDPECFKEKLKRRWLERTVHTRTTTKFTVPVSGIPPIMAPGLIGSGLYNTELEKKSVYLKENSQPNGDPAMLHKMFSDGLLDMSTLSSMSLESIQDICKTCKIVYIGKSKALLIADLESLYSSMLVGMSPCHGYNRSAGHTGGFYHLVCRHGCTFGSKFLALTESVRDAADLYMSLKYTPTTFICDSPCGMARHLELRNKEFTANMWGENCGCFEKPTLDKLPQNNLNVPDIIPSEFRANSESNKHPEQLLPGEHPVSGSTQHFILGDRFHSSTNPHKSPLCAFHNIDLCQQANSITTSTQESENNRKNVKRLRSTCQQSFEVHYMYNFLMDFYQNEAIVKEQKFCIQKNMLQGETLERNEYGRFVIL